jgi:hypothetical protein
MLASTVPAAAAAGIGDLADLTDVEDDARLGRSAAGTVEVGKADELGS